MTRRKSSMKRKAGVVALVGAAAAGVLIWRYIQCGGLGPGGGEGGEKSTAARRETTKEPKVKRVKRPLKVVIDGDQYMVGGVRYRLPKILELAKRVPKGRGPTVEVLRKDSSTARAEKRISTELRAQNIDFVMRDLD